MINSYLKSHISNLKMCYKYFYHLFWFRTYAFEVPTDFIGGKHTCFSPAKIWNNPLKMEFIGELVTVQQPFFHWDFNDWV